MPTLHARQTEWNEIPFHIASEDHAMAKGSKKKKAKTIFLVCEETGAYNYTLRRKPGGEKLKLNKYCPQLTSTRCAPKRRSDGRHGQAMDRPPP